MELEYYCDEQRHLVCVPYSVENLHKMAEDLGIKKNWYHSKRDHYHYDIPKKMFKEVLGKSNLVSTRVIWLITTSKLQEYELQHI